MSVLDGLNFVKKVPVAVGTRSGLSPVERGRRRLLADLGIQIALADDPSFEVVKQTKKRSGGVVETKRKPRSWANVQGDEAFIIIRFSNKPMSLGGKRGSIVKCDANAVADTLHIVREWAQSPEADEAIMKMVISAKRKPRAPKE